MTAIQMTADNEFKLTARGCEMTLRKMDGEWVMYTQNAATRALRRGISSAKYFDSLQQVEAQYKTWRGIAALVS